MITKGNWAVLKWMAILVCVFLATIVTYDVYAYCDNRDNTISRAMWRLGEEYPAVPWIWTLGGFFLTAALAAHFWWGQSDDK